MRTRKTDTTRTQQVITYQSDWSVMTLCLAHEDQRLLGMEQVKHGLHDGVCDICANAVYATWGDNEVSK